MAMDWAPLDVPAIGVVVGMRGGNREPGKLTLGSEGTHIFLRASSLRLASRPDGTGLHLAAARQRLPAGQAGAP
jgi:hypothetical protein